MSKPRIGLAMLVQNEERHLPISIAQFYHMVDDIVVVDGGSADGSVSWAEKMGARVVHRPFANHFSDQKNFAIEQLDTDWVYLHDPDERLEPTLVEILPFLVSLKGQQFLTRAGLLPENENLFDCIGLPRKNFIDGLYIPPSPDYQYRLFARYCRFEGAVHEKIVNFTNRTELDYSHPNDAARFNILHYKSSTKQKEHDELYSQIKGEN